MAEQRGVFDDHQAVCAAIERMRVHELKEIIKGLNNLNDGVPRWAISGKKNEFVTRIRSHVTQLKERGMEAAYSSAKQLIEHHYGSRISQQGLVNRRQQVWQAAPPQTLGGASMPPMHTYGAPYQAYSNGHGSMPSTSAASTYSSRGQAQWPTFVESPFYKVEKWLAKQDVEPHPRDPTLKLQTRLHFAMGDEDAKSLQEDRSLQVRLFCAPFHAWTASFNAQHPAAIEFPITADIRVNGYNLSVNVRGKKTPAKVPPPDLNKDNSFKMQAHQYNLVDLISSNFNKRYVMGAAICKSFSAEYLAEDVRKNKLKDKSSVLKELRKAAEDDDIEVGDVSIGLKCPLSYMRLQNPARSEVCAHTQCFDALAFYSVNEQSPSWKCPTCERVLKPDSIFLDGYMLDILRRVPEDVETVIIDAEGRWRTSDGKYRSDESKSQEAGASLAPQVGSTNGNTGAGQENGRGEVRVKGEDDGVPSSSRGTPLQRKEKEVEVLDLDDDDDELPTPPHQQAAASMSGPDVQSRTDGQLSGVSASAGQSSGVQSTYQSAHEPSMPNASTSASARNVIDLTLSDSDEDEAPPPPRPNRPRLLAPLPTAPARTSSHPQRPVNGAPNVAWDLIDRLASSSHDANYRPVLGGTFQHSRIVGNGDYAHVNASQYSRAPSTNAGQSASPSLTQPTVSSTAERAPTSAPAPAPVQSLASRLGQQIADPYEQLATSEPSNGSERAQNNRSAGDDETGDESLPVTRTRKRPRRNSVLLGREDEDEGETGTERNRDYAEEFRDVNFDDFDLELEANAGLASQPPAENGAKNGSLAERLDAPAAHGGDTRASSARRSSSELSDGLYEDERAGLSSAA